MTNRDERNTMTSETTERANVEHGSISGGKSDTRDASREDAGFLPETRMGELRVEWDEIQTGFVDDPRAAVQRAQSLVRTMVDELTARFAREREGLENQWSSGDVDTEALRVALQRYRSFFNRLLAT